MNKEEQRKHRKAKLITLSVVLLLTTALLIVLLVRACAPESDTHVNALYFYEEEDDIFLAHFNEENNERELKITQVKNDIENAALTSLLTSTDFTYAFGRVPTHKETLDVLQNFEVIVLNALAHDEILWTYTNIVHLNAQYPLYGSTLINAYNANNKTALIIDDSALANSLLESSTTFNFDVLLSVENDATNFNFEINELLNNDIATVVVFVSFAMYENLVNALAEANPTLIIISTDFYLLNSNLELPLETQMYYYTPFMLDNNAPLRDVYFKRAAILTHALIQKLTENLQVSTFNHEFIHHEISLNDGAALLEKYLY